MSGPPRSINTLENDEDVDSSNDDMDSDFTEGVSDPTAEN
jgi:hypothetical protein